METLSQQVSVPPKPKHARNPDSVFCTHCGHRMSPEAAICVRCGVLKNKSSKHCPLCAAPVNDAQDICVSCGHLLHRDGGTSSASGVLAQGVAGSRAAASPIVAMKDRSFCRHCGHQLDSEASVCLNCGVFRGKGIAHCAKCGGSVSEFQDICLNCGSLLAESSGSGARRSYPNPSNPREMGSGSIRSSFDGAINGTPGDLVHGVFSNDAIATTPAPVALRSRNVAFALAFFAGGVGAHNFYLGRTKRGIAQAVLCVFGVITGGLLSVPLMIWVITESILILMSRSRPESSYGRDAWGRQLI